MNSKSFSGADLEKALTEGALTQAQTTLIGMVKPSEKSGHVSFSQAGCDTWVDLSTDMIERADQEGQRPCRDHTHPVMRITLKEPKDAQAKILWALLAQAAPPSPTQLPANVALPGSPSSAQGFPGPASAQSFGWFYCHQVCVEHSRLFPNICNRWVWRCETPWGPIVFGQQLGAALG